MIDLRAARNDPDGYRAALARKGGAGSSTSCSRPTPRWRALQTQVEELRARHEAEGQADARAARGAEGDQGAAAGRSRSELARRRSASQELLDRVPNPPAEDTPDGDKEDDAVDGARWRRAAGVRLRAEGPPRSRGAARLDRRRARREGLRLALRLPRRRRRAARDSRCTAGRSRGSSPKGHVPMLPPVLVREEAMYGTGFFPSEKGDFYAVPERRLYLVGTSEVPLAAFHMGEELDEAAAPLRRVLDLLPPRGGRRRQRHARHVPRAPVRQGRDVRLLRARATSRDEHERLLAIEEELVQELELPYRVLNIAAGDLGASAAKKYDIEAWFPGQSRYREITSTSNTTDFQARRLDDPLPPRRQARARAHAERHRRHRARDDRDPRELPGRGRLGRRARARCRVRRAVALGSERVATP